MKTHSLSCVIATALLLSACGGSSTSAPENTNMPTEASSQVAESTSAQPQATSQSSTAPQEGRASSSSPPSADAVTPVTSVFPVDTRTAADGQIGILMSPTGNIGCDIWAVEGYAACGVISYYDDAKYPGDSTIGPAWVFPLGNDIESIEIAPRGDAMFFMMGQQVGPAPQVVEYGTTARYGAIECASETEAMTCTNTMTGRGVIMSREGYETF
ncbi:hypothetical protein [Rothia nasisuis]|uniref:hypothetical protein n=1 Tax=Rothia nasisuis TaxID=2109647 RepID=UPI001F41353D|nr:hypothetical protein [Rothia nasisuis]